ncbi:dephospho-CoA kinase [Halovulum dunhuangense]|uniref:Dephospho-CoA kinase n=1 Tax=Halovulum dunhuangense TaxID=1505036 RepID=A0A849KUT8_9RHOB|nr:dephospho-CoA kinase [Halovulum dunhuangense]NNU79098.1 dephospho-CoA kinase [Halovulum dunhuangense]
MTPRRPFRLGLTGSIAMGKSTTAAMFRDAGVPVWDADAAVHKLYAQGGAAVAPVAGLVPSALRDGGIDRAALSRAIRDDARLLPKIEAIVHPLVRAEREAFVASTESALVVFDIPLLFETGGDADCDAIVVVTAPADVQRARALSRPGADPARFEGLLARQLPDAEKRARADYIIDTSRGLEDARAQVQSVLESVKERINA